MVRVKILFFILLIVLLSSLVVANCSDDYITLNSFYKASSDEDYSRFISLMDTDYIYSVLASENDYKAYVESAWDVYDVLHYSLKELKCVDLPSGSIIFFNLDSTIKMGSEQTDLNRDYVAVFENGKIQFVTDLELFSLHQNQAYLLQYYNVTSDIVKQEMSRAESLASSDLSDYDSSSHHYFWWVFLLVIILLGVIYAFGKHKGSFHGLKKSLRFKRRKSTKLNFINKLCLRNLFFYFKKLRKLFFHRSVFHSTIKPFFVKSYFTLKKSFLFYLKKFGLVSRRSFEIIKPRIDESFDLGKKELNRFVEKSKPLTKKLSVKTAELARTFADRLDGDSSSEINSKNSRKSSKK